MVDSLTASVNSNALGQLKEALVKSPSTPVTSLATLMSALSGAEPRNLDLQTSVACPYSITLPPGFSLTGKDKDRCVLSFSNGDGIGLTANNQVSGITIIAMPSVRAIYTQAGISDMGTITLSDLAVTGQVSILTRTGTDNLDLAWTDCTLPPAIAAATASNRRSTASTCIRGR